MWYQVRESNPSHGRGRLAPSPPRHRYSLGQEMLTLLYCVPVNYPYEGRKLILNEACNRRRYISYVSGSEQTTLERLKWECANGLLINLSSPNDSFFRTSTALPLINVGRYCRNSATYTSVNCSKTLVRPPWLMPLIARFLKLPFILAEHFFAWKIFLNLSVKKSISDLLTSLLSRYIYVGDIPFSCRRKGRYLHYIIRISFQSTNQSTGCRVVNCCFIRSHSCYPLT